MKKRLRVATTCQGGCFRRTIQGNLDYMSKVLDELLPQKPDIVCLPEAFTVKGVGIESVKDVVETVPGMITESLADKAKAYESHIICPLYTEHDGKFWNSAIVIDREGRICGIYDKKMPVLNSPLTSHEETMYENGVSPGKETSVFDLDFGSIAILICYDMVFDENWKQIKENDIRLVLWPSAYNGGFMLQTKAYRYGCYVVSSVRTDKARIINPLGEIIEETDAKKNYIIQELNLDFLLVPIDFNDSVLEKIRNRYSDRICMKHMKDDNLCYIETVDENITMEQIQEEVGLMSVRQVKEIHRKAHRK